MASDSDCEAVPAALPRERCGGARQAQHAQELASWRVEMERARPSRSSGSIGRVATRDGEDRAVGAPLEEREPSKPRLE